MSTETSTDTALSSDEIDALVEHAESSDFDDGQYRVHGFVLLNHRKRHHLYEMFALLIVYQVPR